MGADILGTIMRQSWFPFTFGIKEPTKERSDQLFIPVSGPACKFQKTVTHNFGRSNDKDFNLAATAYRNGHSSAVALTLTSDTENSTTLDFVIATAKGCKTYFSNLSRSSRFMLGFEHLVGEDPFDPDNCNVGDQSHVNQNTSCHFLKLPGLSQCRYRIGML